jgi:Ser/Thr protein kinase RdoA (MazF antagonist)
MAIEIHPSSGRNRLFLVKHDTGVVWLAKQDLAGSATEGWFYEEVAERVGSVPSCILAEPENAFVVLEVERGSRTLEHLEKTDPASVIETLVALAGPLARLHTFEADRSRMPFAKIPLPELDPVNALEWASMSEGAKRVTRDVQANPVLARTIREAFDGLGPRGLIHADLKLDNILSDSDNRPVLLDWECAGLGPLAWDLGAAVGSMLLLWADRLTLDGRADETRGWIDEEHIFTAARRFMSAYREYTFGAGPGRLLPQIVAGYASAFIILRTWIEASLSPTAPRKTPMRLFVARAILDDPTHLLGRSE